MQSTTSPADHVSPADVAKIAEWLRVLIEPGQVAELRALNVPVSYGKPATYFGFYDYGQLDTMARDADRLSVHGASGVYWALNPVNYDLLARSANRIRVAKSGETTSDRDIIRRRWLLIDADPTRPAGISATDEEKEHARRVIVDVGAVLFDAAWSTPIMADSGNGYHLLYPIDLPADDSEVVKRCLLSLAAKCGNEHVSIDTAVFNPARICKLYGTVGRKGDSIPSRPHRRSEIISIPSELTPVPIELLEQLAAQAPTATTGKSTSMPPRTNGHSHATGVLDVETWLTTKNVEILNRDTGNDGVSRWFIPCPGIAAHNTTNGSRDCVVTQESSGKLGGKCFHDSCGMRSWQDISEAIGKPTRGDYPTPPTRTSTTTPQRRTPLPAGTKVKCSDRGNLGDVVHDDGGDTITVEHVNPETGDTATVDHSVDSLTLADGSPLIPTGFTLSLKTSEEFLTTNYRQHFLIRRLLVEGQCCILGGPKKVLKTSLLVDLAISLGTGTQFLGHPDFIVPAAVNVMLLSGESGGYTLRETAQRIALAKGRLLSSASVFWGFDLPQLGNGEHLKVLADEIERLKIKVAIIDPAYLCLLSAGASSNITANVFAMGALLKSISDIGQRTGCTIIIAHHTRKADRQSSPFGVPDLEDLSGSGFAEWARQWFLLNRREAYEAGSGQHRLWLNVGGSAGHSGTWALDINEGIVSDDGDGRTWDVAVTKATEAVQQSRAAKEEAKEKMRKETAASNAARLLDLVKKSSEPLTATKLKTKTGMNTATFETAIGLLEDEIVEVQTKGGNGRTCIVYRLKNRGENGADNGSGQ